MFELAGLNDRAAAERRPQSPTLPGLQRPSDLHAVGCQERDGNVRQSDNLQRDAAQSRAPL